MAKKGCRLDIMGKVYDAMVDYDSGVCRTQKIAAEKHGIPLFTLRYYCMHRNSRRLQEQKHIKNGVISSAIQERINKSDSYSDYGSESSYYSSRSHSSSNSRKKKKIIPISSDS